MLRVIGTGCQETEVHDSVDAVISIFHGANTSYYHSTEIPPGSVQVDELTLSRTVAVRMSVLAAWTHAFRLILRMYHRIASAYAIHIDNLVEHDIFVALVVQELDSSGMK